MLFLVGYFSAFPDRFCKGEPCIRSCSAECWRLNLEKHLSCSALDSAFYVNKSWEIGKFNRELQKIRLWPPFNIPNVGIEILKDSRRTVMETHIRRLLLILQKWQSLPFSKYCVWASKLILWLKQAVLIMLFPDWPRRQTVHVYEKIKMFWAHYFPMLYLPLKHSRFVIKHEHILRMAFLTTIRCSLENPIKLIYITCCNE